MRKRIVSITLVFTLVITGVFLMVFNSMDIKEMENKERLQIVALNEIQELTKKAIDDESYTDKLEIKISELQNEIKGDSISNVQALKNKMKIVYISVIAFILIIFSYIYIRIIKPFNSLEGFAEEVSKGNLEVPLYIERKNIFGDFSYAFDRMREEIKYSKERERTIIENNKTVISTISHDIKTPVASIRAYCEGLKSNMDSTYERRERYLSVIMKKCDEVTRLTNDLFLHALTDLEKLEINLENHNSKDLIERILGSIKFDSSIINIVGEIPSLNILADEKRLNEVFQNIVNNSLKYGNGEKIDLYHSIEDGYLCSYIKDYGEGISDKDMPFIFNKFYRGENVKGKEGSGLGLYIVKYIMDNMKGEVAIKNRCDGVTLILKIKIS
ncbi:ATP-binding protein [Clostridium paraputrificum]|uniref:sensor histidine kinase n=1 Tax=Clostridium paraputrificum TaxID=29363 RepID=UPI003D325209